VTAPWPNFEIGEPQAGFRAIWRFKCGFSQGRSMTHSPQRAAFAALTILAGIMLAGCASAQTRPILDSEGRVRAGSIASLEKIRLGGVDQWILIRGEDVQKPLLLKLHGGPGQAEMATVGMNRLLEKDFVVVEWDQRGAGKSAAAFSPEAAMTADQLVEDTHDLTELLLARFHRKNLILVGHSWGSVIGIKTVARYPEAYRAFVSTGQMANFSEGLKVGYAFLTEEAAHRRDTRALNELQTIGPPPYLGAGSAARRATYGKWLQAFGVYWRGPQPFDRVGWMMASTEYSWSEKLAFTAAADRSFERLLPELLALDLSTTTPTVSVPVYFAVGRHDQMAPWQVSQAYFATLSAPAKTWVWFEGSAHFPQWEEPQAFHDLLTARVLPETEGR
jgi:pimeloyl-ACP methyl ester carboxylesterase